MQAEVIMKRVYALFDGRKPDWKYLIALDDSLEEAKEYAEFYPNVICYSYIVKYKNFWESKLVDERYEFRMIDGEIMEASNGTQG